MNLNNDPSVSDLASIIAKCDDNSSHHVLWVDVAGNVYVTPLNGITPVGFEEQQKSNLAMRYETFGQGNGYVGIDASKDTVFLQGVLNHLIANWAEREPGSAPTYIG